MNPAPARLTISLNALAQNYSYLQQKTKARVAGVIKADGYGLGVIPVFETLYNSGARDFFVATPDEGVKLSPLKPDISIYILGGLYDGAEDFYVQHNLIPVLNSLQQIKAWAEHAKKLNKKLPAMTQIDTGMNRLGISSDEAQHLSQERNILSLLDLRAILSHFACSDEKDHAMNEAQAAAFHSIAQIFPFIPKSLCNSSGIFRNPNWHYDLVRPGYALYGGNPTPENPNPMMPVVQLEARVLQIHRGMKGQSAGYGASHRFKDDTPLATVALGYADGFLRSGSNQAKLYWRGIPCPVVGRISMDLTIVDLGACHGTAPQEGDWLEVIGPHQDIDTLASASDTIGYEILTSLGPRYQRIYKDWGGV
jgi:alanine racemase